MTTTAAPKSPPKTNQKTWLDWQHEVLPVLPDPDTETLLSREEFLAALDDDNLDVNEVTLVYWEKEGLLPRAVRRWREVPHSFYPMWMLPAVRYLVDLKRRGTSLDQIKPKMIARMPMWVMSSVQWKLPVDDAAAELRPLVESYVRLYLGSFRGSPTNVAGAKLILVDGEGNTVDDDALFVSVIPQ